MFRFTKRAHKASAIEILVLLGHFSRNTASSIVATQCSSILEHIAEAMWRYEREKRRARACEELEASSSLQHRTHFLAELVSGRKPRIVYGNAVRPEHMSAVTAAKHQNTGIIWPSHAFTSAAPPRHHSTPSPKVPAETEREREESSLSSASMA